MRHSPSTLEAHPQNPQKHLSTYLLMEMASRGATLQGLASALQICPEVLAGLLHEEKQLTPCVAWKLGAHWEISPEVLWHWQQDIAALDQTTGDVPS